MSDKDTKVNNNTISDDDIFIERCPHDKENPYTMIRNDLIRDVSISPNCRWLITYLLSNKAGWKINMAQVMDHVKPFMGKDKVQQIFNEAIEAGYMKRVVIKRKNPKGGSLKGYQYFISETAKFKKFHRQPENQDTGDQCTGLPATKERTCEEGTSKERTNPPLSPPTPKPEKPKPKSSGGGREISFNRKSNSFDGITPEYLALLKAAYPDIDVDQQLKEMAIWLLTHTHRDGTQGFITNWLKKVIKAKPNETPKYVPEVEVPFEVDPELAELMKQRDARIKQEMKERMEQFDEG